MLNRNTKELKKHFLQERGVFVVTEQHQSLTSEIPFLSKKSLRMKFRQV